MIKNAFFFFTVCTLTGWTVSVAFAQTTPCSGEIVAPCDEQEHLALIPAPLEETWAINKWMPRHEEKLQAADRKAADLVFLGNSITQGWEGTGEKVWDEYFGNRKAFNLGFSGDRTENVLWRLHHGQVDGMNPSLVVLLIGTNNTGHRQDPPEVTIRGIEMILDELWIRLPDTRVLLMAIFPRGETSGDPLRQLNDNINRKLSSLSDGRRVHFLNINEEFLDESGRLKDDLMPDLLHPVEEGYQVWAKAMEPTLKKLLKNN